MLRTEIYFPIAYKTPNGHPTSLIFQYKINKELVKVMGNGLVKIRMEFGGMFCLILIRMDLYPLLFG